MSATGQVRLGPLVMLHAAPWELVQRRTVSYATGQVRLGPLVMLHAAPRELAQWRTVSYATGQVRLDKHNGVSAIERSDIINTMVWAWQHSQPTGLDMICYKQNCAKWTWVSHFHCLLCFRLIQTASPASPGSLASQASPAQRDGQGWTVMESVLGLPCLPGLFRTVMDSDGQ